MLGKFEPTLKNKTHVAQSTNPSWKKNSTFPCQTCLSSSYMNISSRGERVMDFDSLFPLIFIVYQGLLSCYTQNHLVDVVDNQFGRKSVGSI